MDISISTELFLDFLNCRYKVYLKLSGKSGNKTDFEEFQNKMLQNYQHRAREHLLKSYGMTVSSDTSCELSEVTRQKLPIAVNVTIAHGESSVFLDAIEYSLRPTSSKFEYIPILFVPQEKITRDHKLLLAFCGLILAHQQVAEPRIGKIIYGDKFTSTKVQLDTPLKTASKINREIIGLKDANHPPSLRLNAHCQICEFRETCYATAKEKDDLSLFKTLSEKEIEKLNKRGIFTVTQYSYTFRPRRARKRAAHHIQKHHHALNALAIRTQTIYISGKPEFPSTALRLYLDVEGIPYENFYYLIGLLVDDGISATSHYFWANNKSEEKAIWNAFLSKISTMKDFVLFHYGSYESKFIKQMQNLYGGNAALLEKLKLRTFNVLSAIYGNVYFPTYSNDLKSVASFLGFKWSERKASGIQSLAWRHQWEETKDSVLKQKLITYNYEDCLALQAVTNILESLFANNNNCNSPPPIVHTNDIKPDLPYKVKFKRNDFCYKELERINQCAYFNYQRSKVYFRTNPEIRKSLQRKELRGQMVHKVNKDIFSNRPSQCPECSTPHPLKHGNFSKIVYDLKLFNGGIKRWVVRYRTARYICKQCKKDFFPETYQSVAPSKFGHALIAWSVYQSIARLKSYGTIAEDLGETFGYWFKRQIIARFKGIAANYYTTTYLRLTSKLKSGNLIHADETKIDLIGMTGYIWAFTNLEEAIYIYNDSREGSVLRNVLDGFKGVLVSDFYTAYDSIPCVQQKCLIHLIRDINDDILKNPFDVELKELGKDFTMLLTPIIETIDKYGLKKWHLNKHKVEVGKFFNKILEINYMSDFAKNYQRRFRKYKYKLFTFLEYDGIPWNNNNAEHAIKHFANLRRVIGGSSTVEGIREYLVLLSIYETLRFKNVSFLKFLMSGVTDIDEFLN